MKSTAYKISPEELLQEIKAWDENSWKSFIESNVVPIHILADSISKQFVGDASADVAGVVAKESKRVLDVAGEVLGDISMSYTPPEDPIECLRLFVEYCANTFLGVGDAGKYTLFAWTLRKITREYLSSIYPSLKDHEKRAKIFGILGIDEKEPLFIPQVRSKLVEDLTILGYPDYPSLFKVEEWGDTIRVRTLPSERKTFGGSLCRLVDTLTAVLKRPGMLSGIELSSDPVSEYRNSIPSKPESGQIYSGSWVNIPWSEFYTKYDGGKLNAGHVWVIEGFSVKCVDYLSSPSQYSDSYVKQETNLLSFLRSIMPSIITGSTEMLLNDGWNILITIERTV